MKCKFCFADMDEESVVCPACGKNQEEALVEEQSLVEETVEESAEEVTEEVIAEEEEAAAKPKKKMSKGLKIALAIVGGVVLLAVVAGAILYGLGINILKPKDDVMFKNSYTQEKEVVAEKTDMVVATLGNQELTSGELQIYYWMSVSNYANYYGDYLTLMGFKLDTPLEEQEYDPEAGKNFQQFFLESAIKDWCQWATLMQMAERDGFTLNEEEKLYLKLFEVDVKEMALTNGYSDVDQFIRERMYPGSTLEDYLKTYRMSYESQAYYHHILFDSIAPTMDETEAYFAENEEYFTNYGITKDSGDYHDVRHILIMPEGDTEDDWENCRVEAQALLDEFLSGDATEEIFAEMAKEHSEDGGSKANGGVYMQLTESTNFVEEFKNWYLDESRQPGDTGLVKSMHGYHVMYYSGKEPVWVFETNNMLVADKMEEVIMGFQEENPVKVDYSKIILGEMDLQALFGQQ